MNNESTYMEYQPVCRTAIDPRAPNAWQTCEATWANPAAGNSVRNTTALSAPAGASITSNLLIQFGVSVRKKSGAGGNPMAEINVLVAFTDVVNTATTLLHELVHLAAQFPIVTVCSPGFATDRNLPSVADDNVTRCWRLQAQTALRYALSRWTCYGTSGDVRYFLYAGQG